MKIYYFSHWSDLNAIIESVLAGDLEANNKKYIAQGKESLSFTDIDNLIRQVYCPAGSFQTINSQLKSLLEKLKYLKTHKLD